jgi:Fe-S-cluster containining protein
MKEKILQTLYSEFEKWAAPLSFVCKKGCALCCTQNVTITALEGEQILQFIQREELNQWFADRIKESTTTGPPLQTINEYAEACKNGIESDEPDFLCNSTPCPFLEENCCRIYPVRPFACRCFTSERVCDSGGTAIQPEYYIAAATAILQIIEHLGQNEYWGNMRDVLLALCDISRYQSIGRLLPDRALVISARIRTRKARPSPGLILTEEDRKKVAPLLACIFSTQIEGKSVGEILNGR